MPQVHPPPGVWDDKDTLVDNVIPVLQPVANIVQDAFLEFSAILFSHTHFSVRYFNAGPQMQQVGPQGCHGRASAALTHIVQSVQQEAGLYTARQVPEALCNLGRREFVAVGQFYSLADDMTMSGGKLRESTTKTCSGKAPAAMQAF